LHETLEKKQFLGDFAQICPKFESFL